MLLEIDEQTEKRILIKLDIDDLVSYDNITEKTIVNFLNIINNNINIEIISNNKTNDYKRISTTKKIEINNLLEIKEKLEIMISKLYIIENAISSFNRIDPTSYNKYTTIINYIISIYEKNSHYKQGFELFDSIVNEISNITPQLTSFVIPIELFVVYIFDKCDIFKKE